MVSVRQLEELVRPIVEGKGAWLIETSVRREHGSGIVEISIDNATGVTTEQCADISREISKALDSSDLVRGRYYLTVASPGTDRPLKFAGQYRKHIGRKIRLKVRREEGVTQIEGVLAGADETSLLLETGPGTQVPVAFDTVISGIVCTPW